ncbi:hypothetical protein ACN47E_003163 [Coniothyrium glycines]
MASTFASSSSISSSAFDILEQAKHQFWIANANLTEEERQHRWLEAASTLPTNAFASVHPSTVQQTPRSLPFTFDRTQLSIPSYQSAPSMARVDSTNPLESSDSQRIPSNYSDWQSPNEYALYSSSTQSQSFLHSIPEATCSNVDGMVSYSPGEYVSNYFEPASSPTLPLSFPKHPSHLSVQLTPQWISSSESSTSPSTPSTALMTPVTQSSNAMSRQGSCNPEFLNHVSMLRVQSDSSCMLPILSEDGSFPSDFDVASKPISSDVDGSHFLYPTGPPASGNFFPCANSVFQSTQVLASPDNDQSCLAEDMQRSTSASSGESFASDASAPSSTCSRQSRREREVNAQAASRKIAPKAIEIKDKTESAPCNAQMARIRSEDGSSKTVGLLTKTPYVRPQHPKIMCQYCDERPEGFRGTHELDRHIARTHASTRKGFICVDYSDDKKFLANCKHCRNKKVYGAYYNAAAHLRRAHFHPRKRGRKGKNDEKRGGIGGGDHPAMDYLKTYWIKEVEVGNKATTAQSPRDADDTSGHVSNPAYGNPYRVDTVEYPPSQQQLPSAMTTQMPIDPSQFIGYGMDMQSDQMLYDNTAYTAYDPNMMPATDVANFQFDSYTISQ